MKTQIATEKKLALLFLTLFSVSCTTPLERPVEPLPMVPEYATLAHPDGYDLVDIQVVMKNIKAPSLEEVKTCDANFRKLESVTPSREEFERGVRELVNVSPEKYHWCFYGKILELEAALKEPKRSLKSRQLLVVDTYSFLAPFARAFRDEYQDSRYWKWAISHYARMSELVYYQRIEPSPESTQELAEFSTNPYALVRKPASAADSVLRKYGIGGEAEIFHGPVIFDGVPGQAIPPLAK